MTKIFLDLDGVVTNWFGGALELFPDYKTIDTYQKLKEGIWLDEIVGKTKLWHRIAQAGPDFWADLEPLPWTQTLMSLIQHRGTVCVLTSPGDNEATPHAVIGKIKWLKKHCEGVSFLIGKDKWVVASSDAWLIDDTTKHIRAFRKAGGNAFLWPNQYTMSDDVLNETMGKLASLMPLVA